MAGHRIYTTSVASIYPLYVAKAERKGRTHDGVDAIIGWLTGAAFGGEQVRPRTDNMHLPIAPASPGLAEKLLSLLRHPSPLGLDAFSELKLLPDLRNRPVSRMSAQEAGGQQRGKEAPSTVAGARYRLQLFGLDQTQKRDNLVHYDSGGWGNA